MLSAADNPPGAPLDPDRLVLRPFLLWYRPHPGPADGAGPPPRVGRLLAAIRSQLERQDQGDAEPLRWAITAVDPQKGLRIEGIAIRRPTPEAGGGPGDPEHP